jgi:hypothetical protein
MPAYLPARETIVEHISVLETEPASVKVQGDSLSSFIEAPMNATDSQGDVIFKGMMAGLIGNGDGVPTVMDNVSLVHSSGRGNSDIHNKHNNPFWASSPFTKHTSIDNGNAVATSVADNVSLVHDLGKGSSSIRNRDYNPFWGASSFADDLL